MRTAQSALLRACSFNSGQLQKRKLEARASSDLVRCRLESTLDHYMPTNKGYNTMPRVFIHVCWSKHTMMLSGRSNSHRHRLACSPWFVTDRVAGSLVRWSRCIRYRHHVSLERISGWRHLVHRSVIRLLADPLGSHVGTSLQQATGRARVTKFERARLHDQRGSWGTACRLLASHAVTQDAQSRRR